MKSRTKKTGLSKEEINAMKERIEELNAGGDVESAVLKKIGAMSEPDRSMAKKIHSIVKVVAPDLTPRLWYGMPAYSNKEGKVVCFFQDARKFKTRYATFGFSDKANLDDGDMWSTGFALKKMSAVTEKKISELVKKAVN